MSLGDIAMLGFEANPQTEGPIALPCKGGPYGILSTDWVNIPITQEVQDSNPTGMIPSSHSGFSPRSRDTNSLAKVHKWKKKVGTVKAPLCLSPVPTGGRGKRGTKTRPGRFEVEAGSAKQGR